MESLTCALRAQDSITHKHLVKALNQTMWDFI